MKETIKDVEGYSGRYKISNKGEVISYPNGSYKSIRILKQEINRRGKLAYRRVTLCINGKPKRYQVHILVAKAFIPNPENKPFINHIDNDGENNNDWNLEWCTHSENMIHAQKQGRLFNSQSKGGSTNATIVEKQILKNLSLLLGNRLISTEIRERTKSTCRFVTYQCKHCSNIYTRRSDAVAVVRGGICTDCFRKR